MADEREYETQIEALSAQVDDLTHALVALTAERDRYKAALEKYGAHPRECHNRVYGSACNCGLREALAPTDTKGE